MYQKTIYFAANGNFGIKLGFFSFFSKIPRGIGKISFDTMFYIAQCLKTPKEDKKIADG